MTSPDPFSPDAARHYDTQHRDTQHRDVQAMGPPTSTSAGTYRGDGYGAAPAGSAGGSTAGRTDGVSIAALIAGLVGGGVVAIVLGAIGLRRTAQGARQGTGMAWTGTILGIVGTLAWAAVLTWMITMAVVASDGIFTGTPVVDSPPVIDDSLIDGSLGDDSVMGNSDGTYGSDPYLDALWDQCDAGDGAACDVLFSESPLDSEYEHFGNTCGERGRSFGQIWCATSDDSVSG